MTDKNPSDNATPATQNEAPGDGAAAQSTDKGNGKAEKQKDPVRRWTFILLIVAAALLVWYLRSNGYV